MTGRTREECFVDAGEVYGAILADPIRGPEIRAAREAHAALADSVESRRFEQCDATCTTDCGHCKGRGTTHRKSA